MNPCFPKRSLRAPMSATRLLRAPNMAASFEPMLRPSFRAMRSRRALMPGRFERPRVPGVDFMSPSSIRAAVAPTP